MDDQSPPLAGTEKERILKVCRELILKWVSVHFKGYLSKADEQLFRMAEKASSNLQQNRYFQAREEFNRHRGAIEQAYLQHLSTAFNHFRAQRDTAADWTRRDAADLSLVDKDELEEELAVSDMARKASANCSEPLYALHQRLSVLSEGAKIGERGNPAAPGVFAEAMHSALDGLVLDNESKLVMYKIYQSAVMERLPKLYDLLNHKLQEQGVLPNLQYQLKKNRQQLPEELGGHWTEMSLARQAELIALVQQLQAEMRMQRPRPTGVTIPLQELVSALQQLQQGSAGTLAQAETAEAMAHSDLHTLRQQLETQTERAADLDADVVEVVGLLFEYVLNDEQLPDSVKALLSYLHTPFLKVALLDRQFFNHPQHPARQLLNSLVAAGERWVEPESKHKSDVFVQMRAVVERVLKEFNDDLRLFSELAFDFNHFLRQHARRVRLAEQRATEAAKGEDKLKEVRQRVGRFLEQKTEGLELPTPAHQLLFEPWANYLAFNLLRFGAKSEPWQEAVAVVDDVLWYVRYPGSDPQRAAALKSSLQTRIRQGFDTVGYDSAAGRRLLDALHGASEQAASESATATPAPASPPAADIETVTTATPRKRDPLIDQLTELEFGTWFLFDADKGKKAQRVKLAWYNSRTLHFMFVNRLGQQVAVRSGDELAAGLRSGTVKQLSKLDDKPFFEKALERVVDQLRGRKPAT